MAKGFRKRAHRNANLKGGFGKKRYARKRFMPKKAARRTAGKLVTLVSKFAGPGHMVWPEEVKTIMRTSGQTLVGSVAVGGQTACQWLGNSFGDGTTGTNGVGPKNNFAGVYALNYPSGLRSFLQTPAGGGVSAPFNQYRIPSYTIRYRIHPQVDAVNAAGHSAFFEAIDFPVTVGNSGMGNGMSRTQALEQPGAKSHIVYPGYYGTPTTLAVNGGGAPLLAGPGGWWSRRVDCMSVYGLPRPTVSSNPNFYNTVAAICVSPVVHTILVYGDGVGTLSFIIEMEITHDVIFFNRNGLNTLVNV